VIRRNSKVNPPSGGGWNTKPTRWLAGDGALG
jgi:hypothetical protein